MLTFDCDARTILLTWLQYFLFLYITQIVRQDRNLERIVFPVPQVCEFLTEETKTKVFTTAERDEQGSKVADFFERSENMFVEMQWQRKLRG